MKHLLILFSLLSISQASLIDKLTNYTFDDNFDAKIGEEIYKKNHCITCHGTKGDKKSATFRALTSMSASAIKAALVGYQNDKDFGARTKFIMQRYAKTLSTADMDNIVFFIKGHDLYLPNSQESEPTAKTKHNLFIK